MNKLKLRIGTDCSGIEAPIQALKQLCIPFEHIFSSDIDKFVIKSIKANYSPNLLFGDPDGSYQDGDITIRDIKDVPDIDLYVCGFPCQPFSTAGDRKGFNDTRGNVFWSCLDVIKKKKPKYFILENVRGLISHNKGETFKTILGALNKLDEYTVNYKILNTKDYGIPQNRERIYIIGIKDINSKFEWPLETCSNLLTEYIDIDDNKYQKLPERVEGMFDKLPKGAVFVNLGFIKTNKYKNSHIFSPTLTSTSNQIWCIPKNRYANVQEYLGLQGFPKSFKQVVSKTQLLKQLGNSMSVNVLVQLIKGLLK